MLAVTDPAGNVLAAAGRHRDDWPAFMPPPASKDARAIVSLPSGVFRRISAPLALQDVEIGVLSWRRRWTTSTRSGSRRCRAPARSVISEGRVIADDAAAEAAAGMTPAVVQSLPGSSTVSLGDAEYAVRVVMQSGAAAVYTLDSIDAPWRR